MKDQIVLRVVARFLIPFILLFGLYVQLHGEYSPGGGFQAGVICAAAFFLFMLINGRTAVQNVLPLAAARWIGCLGVLLYGGVGVVTMAMGGNFLEYNVLQTNPVAGQQLGILLIELGVGLTVFAVMLIIIYSFVERFEMQHSNGKNERS